MNLNKYIFSFLLIFSFCGTFLRANPPVADILLMGNIRGKAFRKDFNFIAARNPYSVFFFGGNVCHTAETAGKKLPFSMQEKKSINASRKQYGKEIPYFAFALAVLGEEDFVTGLHGGVETMRTIFSKRVHILDYIGARNNENPFLLKYIDILVNGKKVRFIGLGAWEKLLPKKEDTAYRKITNEVLNELEAYIKTLPGADFTILATCQALKYDQILAENAVAVKLFDLILSHDPSCPLLIEKKHSVPVAGCGQHLGDLRKVYLNPVKNGVGGARIQVWKDEVFAKYLEETKKKKVPLVKKKIKEKKKK